MIKERNIFGLLIIFAIHCSYLIGLDETSVDNETNPVLSTISSLYENVKLDNIVPFLLNHSNQPDQYLTTPELIKKYGYPVEIHTVNTADGYVLELHRIPFSSKSPSAENKPVAFLQHGLLSSSADWIILGPEKSLGYLLADAGYDVWIGNARGNTYSKKHIILSTSDPKFWDFSWHEMGVYDLPAVLDYILSNTNQKNLYYVGHSMGTTMFYVLTSSMPQYNSKIKLMTSLAPIAFLGHSTSPFPKLLSWNPLTYITVDFLGIKQFLPSGDVMTSIANNLCSDKSITQQVCSIVLFALCGFDDIQLNKTILPVLLSHTPAGTSAKSFLHYGQAIASGHFRRYDYGMIHNNVNYGHFSPPDYNLTAITAPVHLVYGDNDWFGDPEIFPHFVSRLVLKPTQPPLDFPKDEVGRQFMGSEHKWRNSIKDSFEIKDVFKLNTSLANSVKIYRVPFSTFNHLDFLWATDVKTLVYDEVMSIMKKY